MMRAVLTVMLLASFGARAQPAGGSLMPCPATGEGFGGGCACWRVEPAPVWGTGSYTAASGICSAAVHAGVIRETGGAVRVVPEPGQSAYAGSVRNGVTSGTHGSAASGFRAERLAGGWGSAPRQ